MASLNLNKVILCGRLTKDIELKQTTSGIAVCDFSIAINRKAKDETDFIDCRAWRNTAEFISKYFKKGNSICVIGSIQNRQWQDKNGNTRKTTEIIVDEANFVDSKSETSQEPNFTELAENEPLPF